MVNLTETRKSVKCLRTQCASIQYLGTKEPGRWEWVIGSQPQQADWGTVKQEGPPWFPQSPWHLTLDITQRGSDFFTINWQKSPDLSWSFLTSPRFCNFFNQLVLYTEKDISGVKGLGAWRSNSVSRVSNTHGPIPRSTETGHGSTHL